MGARSFTRAGPMEVGRGPGVAEQGGGRSPGPADSWMEPEGRVGGTIGIGAILILGAILVERGLFDPGQTLSIGGLRLLGGVLLCIIGFAGIWGLKRAPLAIRLDEAELLVRFRSGTQRIPYGNLTSARVVAEVRWHASVSIKQRVGDEIRVGPFEKGIAKETVTRVQAMTRAGGLVAPPTGPRIIEFERSAWSGSVLRNGREVQDMPWVDFVGISSEQPHANSQVDLAGTAFAETHELADLPRGWWMTMEAHESTTPVISVLLTLASVCLGIGIGAARLANAAPWLGLVIGTAISGPLVVWALRGLRDERQGGVAASIILLPWKVDSVDVASKVRPLLLKEGILARKDSIQESVWSFRGRDRTRLGYHPAGKAGTRSGEVSVLFLGHRRREFVNRQRRLKGAILEALGIVPPEGAEPPRPAKLKVANAIDERALDPSPSQPG